MREIEFRVWHKKRKKYYEVHHLHCGNLGFHEGDWATCKARCCIENKDIYIYVQPNDCILEQYTGLKDNQDKKIFEGDIVRDYEDGTLYEVVFEMSGAQFMFYNFFSNYHYDANDISCFEIIGNIHDDKELLEIK